MRKNGYNMSRDSAAPRRSGNSLWAGILIGTVVGVSLAAGVAWYLTRSHSPFINKEQPVATAPLPDSTKPPASAATDKSTATTADGKPRFEFYKVLTDKPNASVAPPKPDDKRKTVEKSQTTDKKAASTYEPQILQAGSFSNVNDAEKLKAKLALLGVEANIQTATIPDKGVWYRVRLGPYKNADDISRASSFLKQNGVESTPMKVQ
jgi:cell division protein FtsN